MGAKIPQVHRIRAGDALRTRIDQMPNPEYQRLLRCGPEELRRRLADGSAPVARLIAGLDDAALAEAIRNLGGHDLGALDDAYESIDGSRPTVILAYTIKGYGLAMQGHPSNHSALLTDAQFGELAARCCRSACCMTRSSSGPWNRGRSASMPAGSPSWSAPRRG